MLKPEKEKTTLSPYLTFPFFQFKPRQVILQIQKNMKNNQSKSKNTQFHYSLCHYLHTNSFSKTLNKFLSEANLLNQDANWKDCSLDLEQAFYKSLETHSEAIPNSEPHKVQGYEKDNISKNDGVSDCIVASETVNKKKKKKEDKTTAKVEEIVASESDGKSKMEKKIKTKQAAKQVESDVLMEFDNGTVIEPTLDDSKKKKKDKKKQNEKTASESIVDKESKPAEEMNVKSKGKKKRKDTLVSEDLPDKLMDKVYNGKSEDDSTNKENNDSKKRKILISEEKTPEVTDKAENENCKRRKTEGMEDSQPNAHLVKHDILANGNLEKNGEKSLVQKSSKKQNNGSAEPKTVNAFQRIKLDKVVFTDERLQDNSYWAKDGAEVGYGAKAQEILGQVRGRDFRHEKTKKKRGTYRGGQIDNQSHSVKFNYSDEE